jgi:DNA replication protein DnaC
MTAPLTSVTAEPCARCLDRGYVFAPQAEKSRVELCSCQAICRLCGGSGRLIRNKDGALFAAPCHCRDVARRVALYNQAGIPKHFCDKGFDRFKIYERDQENALRSVTSFAQNYPRSRKGLCLWGKPGTGKTHLVCAALQHLTLEKGVPARFVEISFLFSEIREAFQRQISALTALAPLAEIEVLAIDEIGKGRGTEFEKDTLDELLGRRYNADRTTLFTTNCSVSFSSGPTAAPSGYVDTNERAKEALAQQDLKLKIGDRSFSRMAEMVEFHQIVAKDRRIPA